MKAIAYNIKPNEKECLVLANYKKHDITIIVNSLSAETLPFAQGKEVLIVFNEDILDRELIVGLRAVGIKYIATSSFTTQHIDLQAAKEAGFKVANVPLSKGDEFIKQRMKRVIKNLDNWADGKCVGAACCCPTDCDVKSIKI